MRSIVVLLTVALSFVAPVFLATADAARPETVQGSLRGTDCKTKRAKKQDDSKPKKKDKDGKKPYGFEL